VLNGEVVAIRVELAKEYSELEKELYEIKVKRKELSALREALTTPFGQVKFMDIIKETLIRDQFLEIVREIERRKAGEPPLRLGFKIYTSEDGKQLKKYKDLAKELADTMIKARQELSVVINEGCNKYDKGHFMKLMSPVNRQLPTVNELNKIIQVNHL
jgi:hypothetical protein